MNLLELKDISKTYRTKATGVKALKQINLNIKKGSLISIIGTSGSGKSTLLNILGLLDQQDSGHYFINGDLVDDYSAKELAGLRNKMFGFVIQNFSLIEDYSVKDNVRIPFLYDQARKVSKREQDSEIENILRKLKIEDKANEKVKNLSGGQKQRVAIARALINRPEIILADEPTGSLDKKTSEEIMEILIDLNKEGKTVIIITHDQEIASLCNETVKLEDGCIVHE